MERKIFVVSDATGATAEHVLQAALAQFEAGDVKVERRPQTRTVDKIREVVDEARESGGMLVHTLASTDLRREIYLRATERRVHSVDLLGNVLSDLSAFLGAPPGGVPGGLHRFDENYYRRMDALTFVVKHDDGLGLEDLGRAEIVLVGISRTSKTPLSIYLAVRGYFVANVPILNGVEPPQELFKIDQRKVVALRMDPVRLRHIREQRLKSFREDARQAYIDAYMIQQEVAFADEAFKRASWPVVDMTLKSLEEVAVEVVSLATDLPYVRSPEEI
ncbi:MAG TPA: pyruvate, water dikinase regulatory protein [Terriglobia bacterium]|nr:pyruvate, water dikinase regulatory protein [Terriglobia bacterium]